MSPTSQVRRTLHTVSRRKLPYFSPTHVSFHSGSSTPTPIPTPSPGSPSALGDESKVLKEPSLAITKKTTGSSESIRWSSRAQRKGRHMLGDVEVHHRDLLLRRNCHAEADEDGKAEKVKKTFHRLRLAGKKGKKRWGIWMDVSFWVAIVFTFGSIVWVVNSFFVFLPLLSPWKTQLSDETSKKWEETAAALAFVGSTLFEVGSYLGVVEALNRGNEGGFGEEILEELRSLTIGSKDDLEGKFDQKQKFVWWGRGRWRDLGYTANYIQLWAASIFWISTVTGLPGVVPGYPDGSYSVAIVDIFFWVPQVIGGFGFILSSSLLMLEVQRRWYRPSLNTLGWWVGFWNLVGGTGFFLCGVLGIPPTKNEKLTAYFLQSANSTFWGSWAFLIGSVVQTVETLFREDDAGQGQ